MKTLNYILIYLVGALMTSTVIGMRQETLDYMATFMNIRYEVIDNIRDSLKLFEAELSFTNQGEDPIPASEWELYWCQMNLVEPEFLPRDEGVVLDKYKVKLSHLQGCMFKLEPVRGFRVIRPGETRKIRFVSENFSVAKSDVIPNWYLSSNGLESRVLVSTTGESLDFVGEFDTPNKWKRYDWKDEKSEGHDLYDPFTPRTRYAMNADVEDKGRPGKLVIPTPVQIAVDTSMTLNLETRDWQVVAPPVFLNEAEFLADKLGFDVTDQKPYSRFIWFHQADVKVRMKGEDVSNDEVYSLEIDPVKSVIEIKARAGPGALYAVKTLLSLMDDRKLVPRASIVDGPRYPYRGVMLDVGRNFHPKDRVIRLLDTMADYKLNKLHLHLSDDEGWRLEIPGLEELTEVGSQRCHDPEETECLLPFLGSGPVPSRPGSGYYTTEDYQDILRHAKSLHIEVIPELDMPGHGHATIKAMEARKKKLLSENKVAEAERYILVEENDPSVYKSIQLYTDNAINPCLQSTYTFITKVVQTVHDLHKNIMPLNIYHFGGDEVAKGAWENSTACSFTKDKKDIKQLFVRHMSNLTADMGLDLAAWEDGVMEAGSKPYPRNILQNRNVYAYAWDNIWEWGQAGRAYTLANAGYKVVMAQATHLYFDHPYEPDPLERGLYWAPRYTDARKTFSFMAENLYMNADVARSGEPLTHKAMCGLKGEFCPPLKKPKNIVGMQGHLWSELIRNRDLADYMLFPRFLALSERAWHEAAWERVKDNTSRNEQRDADWVDFANTLGHRELRRLDEKGLKYSVPPAGAIIVNNKLRTNVAYPGLTVEYSVDNGDTWCQHSGEVDLVHPTTVFLRTRSANGDRTSRVVSLATYEGNPASKSLA
ncbi:beta-hexosaminidase isoform X2 [Patella vulgata]|uniref:beta-hexosaminidase isoform X2 n=1 Tax=Patella vulgata TaxID=6465 RepID=UPI00217FD1D0|nr:beta-hexosaminidase isoform X2 [Patella vulgata]